MPHISHSNSKLFFFDFSGNDDDGTSLSGQTVSAAALEFTTTANISGFISWTAETDKKVMVCKTDGVGSSIDTGDFNRLDSENSDDAML